MLALTAPFCIALTLFAATFKVRFGLDDTIMLIMPALGLIGVTLIANVTSMKYIVLRIKYVGALMLLLIAALYPFALGSFEEKDLFVDFATNCTLALMVIMFPWDRTSLEHFLTMLVVFGCIASVSTILAHQVDSGSLRSGYNEEVKEGYLSVTFATGLGCIAALHRLIAKFTPVSIGAFVLCWIGIALSLGRGSLLFCAFVSMIYLVVALRVRIATMGKFKKSLLLLFFIGMIPVVFYQAMSIERTAERMLVLFTDTDSGAGVASRFDRYTAAQDRIAVSPILGNGMGAYDMDQLGHPHNMILQFAVDGGMISSILLAVFLLTAVRSFFRGMKIASPGARNTVLAFGILFMFMSLSYMKSHDAYKGREFTILAAFPIAVYLTLTSKRVSRVRGRRRRKRSTSMA